jgi:hypothetical protein
MIIARPRISTISDLVSPPLILVTPFISFIQHNDYSYTAAEFWVCVAGLGAIGLLCGAIVPLVGIWWRIVATAALLTLFVDVQFECSIGRLIGGSRPLRSARCLLAGWRGSI